jgi:nitroimidazol reductase NimA-like FMN-containing flavoprotein (pyridoxamine 5'-phosphate oxidase superfamily)
MSTTPRHRPRFRALDRAETLALLARCHVGRIAYPLGEQVRIEAVHYVYSDGWLYARTAPGEKERMLDDSFYRVVPVAFETDEVEGLFRWRSAVVQGNAYRLDPPQQGGDPADWTDAVRALRALIPESFTADDPVPHRTVVFRIAVQEATGREATDEGEEG